MSETERWRAPEEAAGERLDRYLAERYGVARNRVLHWIRDGAVRVAGEAVKPSYRVAGGEEIACRPRAIRQDDTLTAEPGDLELLYEDDSLVVVSKPAGLVVHPGAGRRRGTLAHRLLARYPEMAAVGGPGRPGIVHRLDRDTTGALAVARTPAAYAALSRAFAERRVEKHYLAVVYGAPSPAEGTIEAPIGRHPTRRKQMAVVPRGRPARTGYRTIAASGGIALLSIDLATGRTHQIRVHLKHRRWPLVGDPIYGEARWRELPAEARRPLRELARPALHAWRLGVPHPDTGEMVRCEAPVPDDLRRLWERVAGGAWPDLPPLRRDRRAAGAAGPATRPPGRR